MPIYTNETTTNDMTPTYCKHLSCDFIIHISVFKTHEIRRSYIIMINNKIIKYLKKQQQLQLLDEILDDSETIYIQISLSDVT